MPAKSTDRQLGIGIDTRLPLPGCSWDELRWNERHDSRSIPIFIDQSHRSRVVVHGIMPDNLVPVVLKQSHNAGGAFGLSARRADPVGPVLVLVVLVVRVRPDLETGLLLVRSQRLNLKPAWK